MKRRYFTRTRGKDIRNAGAESNLRNRRYYDTGVYKYDVSFQHHFSNKDYISGELPKRPKLYYSLLMSLRMQFGYIRMGRKKKWPPKCRNERPFFLRVEYIEFSVHKGLALSYD